MASDQHRKTKAKSATELADQLDGMGTLILETAQSEVRRDLGQHMYEHMLDRTGTVDNYRKSPDDDLIEMLRFTEGQPGNEALQGLADRFDVEGVSDDFRAGLLLAIRLVQDEGYEY